jgi:NhaA family Na+:H+ antiporter
MVKVQENHEDLLPEEPIDRVFEPITRFLHIETASGIVLVAATVVALILANSFLSGPFLAFWKTKVGIRFGGFEMFYSLQHWINDFLMAIFFFVIGLEVKRELVMGELQDLRSAALPIAAAIGGMLVPAVLYLLWQSGAPGERGWGIPMATDIAFVVGCLTILGSRIPASLRIMLLSLAIADDIGAILVIAIGYTDAMNLLALELGIVGIVLIFILMKVGVRNVPLYFILMVVVWFEFHESGIHATIAGVIFGLMCPTKSWISESRLGEIVQKTMGFMQGGGWSGASQRYAMIRQMEVAARKTISPLERFEIGLHPWVGFVIMPIFALANAGVKIELSDFTHPVALAVMTALFLGKPIGVLLFSWAAVRFRIARLPQGLGWGAITGGGFLAGIGFTMALFISSLALEGDLLDAAKIGVLAGSIISAAAGVGLLIFFLPRQTGKS